MKINELLEKEMDESVIKKLYHNELNFMEEQLITSELKKVNNEIKKLEKDILKKEDRKTVEKILEYIEWIHVRESMEAENQFQLGFKTGIKIVIESLK